MEPSEFNNTLSLTRGAQRTLGQRELRWVEANEIAPERLTGVSSLLAWANIFGRLLETHFAKNLADLAGRVEVSRADRGCARITEPMNLLKLDERLQQELLEGRFVALAEHRVRDVLKLTGAEARTKLF